MNDGVSSSVSMGAVSIPEKAGVGLDVLVRRLVSKGTAGEEEPASLSMKADCSVLMAKDAGLGRPFAGGLPEGV